MSQLSLYEISKEGLFIQDCLIDNEGELTPELEARLDALMVAGPDKIEAAGMVVRNIEAAIEAKKAEAKRLSNEASAADIRIDRLKKRMVIALDCAFNGKVTTQLGTYWTQATAVTTTIELHEGETLERLQKERPDLVRVTLSLNKDAIKAELKKGIEPPDCILVDHNPPTRYLRMK